MSAVVDVFMDVLKDSGIEVSVKFTKLDGTEREMKCVWGAESRITEQGNITVWDVEQNGYRSIRPESLISVTVS